MKKILKIILTSVVGLTIAIPGVICTAGCDGASSIIPMNKVDQYKQEYKQAVENIVQAQKECADNPNQETFDHWLDTVNAEYDIMNREEEDNKNGILTDDECNEIQDYLNDLITNAPFVDQKVWEKIDKAYHKQ